MPASDALIARYSSELEERRLFQEQLASGAEADGRDLTTQEMELYTRASDRMAELENLLTPLREGARIASDSRGRTAELMRQFSDARGIPGPVPTVEYRSVGAYVADLYWAAHGAVDAQQRLEVFNRAAAHQTTTDNPGLLPERIVDPLVNFVDSVRPIVSALGPTDLGDGTWAYARVTQHTLVGPQAAEKAELPSRKMTITKTPITAPTLGGYVNVSKQDIQRTSPGILDMVINDLASEYAIETEEAACAVIDTAATAGPALPADPTPADVNSALWAAAASAYTGVRGGGRLILGVSPDMLGLFGGLFAPVNPTNAFSSGFAAGSFGSGAMGAISGITTIMSPGFDSGTAIVINTAAVRAFEYRYGNMQVNEPSVWGVQVGYAGDFQTIVIEPAGLVEITQTP